MMSMPVTYAVYLLLSAAVTFCVAHVLHRRGRVFLVEMFHQQESIADSVNDLLVVGFLSCQLRVCHTRAEVR